MLKIENIRFTTEYSPSLQAAGCELFHDGAAF